MNMDINQKVSEDMRIADSNSTVDGMTDDEKIDLVAAKILEEYRRAFEELAK